MRGLDITGRRFGRLLALSLMGERRNGQLVWMCICDCGNMWSVPSHSLRSGSSKSCGCYRRDVSIALGRATKLPPGERARRIKEARRLKFENDPATAVYYRIACGLRSALSGVREKKYASTFTLVGYTPRDLKEHLERQFRRGMSWKNRSEWHIDHIVPMCTAETKEDVLRLSQLSNLRPLWAVDNLRKNDQREFLV